jgi:predicted AlkP superfamily phosphohydrolase/phosphomutase
VKFVRDLLPKEARQRIATWLPRGLRDKLAQRVDTADIDWSRTRAYCLPTDLEGCIRINLKGREPQGIVEPGAEYESLLDAISVALREAIDPLSGRRVVREVIRSDTAFPGERRPRLPDLVVLWDATQRLSGAESARLGSIKRDSPDPRPGTHTGPGFFAACGPGIARGTTVTGGHIRDLAPTIMARLGVPPASHMRGRVWPELSENYHQGSPAQ